jgi:hypothetical protein
MLFYGIYCLAPESGYGLYKQAEIRKGRDMPWAKVFSLVEMLWIEHALIKATAI